MSLHLDINTLSLRFSRSFRNRFFEVLSGVADSFLKVFSGIADLLSGLFYRALVFILKIIIEIIIEVIFEILKVIRCQEAVYRKCNRRNSCDKSNHREKLQDLA